MRIYSRPLRAYLECTPERSLAGGHDLVHGFFADRLDRPEFFAGWQSSGKPLRQWLKNSFRYYLKEEGRRLRRTRRTLRRDRWVAREEIPSPEEVFDRAYAQEIVREALLRTRRQCEARGLDLHWNAFHEHYYRQRSYSECARALGVTEEQAAVKARSAVRRFKTNLRQLLARERFTSERVEDEILSLLEATG